MNALLTVDALVKRFGGLTATDHVSLTVAPGECHALIGPNGAGKTTVINQLFGELTPDSGRILLDNRDITRLPTAARVRRGLGRTFQITQLCLELSGFEHVLLALAARQGHLFRFLADPHRDPVLAEQARRALHRTGLEHRAMQPVAILSHGERKQLELAIALASEPHLILLDEPMAGLSPAETETMVGLLASLKGACAMLLVEHDMEAVFRLADRISVLVYGRVIAEGDAEAIRRHPEVRTAYLGEETA